MVFRSKKKCCIIAALLCLFFVVAVLFAIFIPKWLNNDVAFDEGEGVTINGRRFANQFGKRLFRPRLTGKRLKDGSLQLMWLIEGWPEKMAGVIIKRQIDGKWIPLVDEASIIVPGTFFERDWKTQGMTAEQSAFYAQELKRCHEENKIKLISPQQQLERARKYGFGAGDGLMFMRNNLYAFLCGFAAIDNHPVDHALYGLFGVSDSGRIDRHPFATWQNLPLEQQTIPLSNFAFVIDGGTRTLFWEIPEELYKKYSIVRFEVYRKENGEWKHFSSAMRFPHHPGARYGLLNPLRDNNSDTEFKFVPLNTFYEPLPATEMKFANSQYGDLSRLEFNPPGIDADHVVTVSWETGVGEQSKIKKLMLERDELGGKSIVLADNIPPEQNSFSDTTPKQYNALYFYNLTAELKNGDVKKCSLKVSSPVPKAKLPAPKNFKVEIVKKGEKDYRLRFSWDPVPGARGYLFHHKNLARPNAMYAQIGGCRKETSFEIEYPASYQTFVYSYGIQALSDDYSTVGDSELSVVENMKLIALRPEYVRDIVWSQNAGEVSLSWKNVDPTTTGLEIFINGESYQKLPPTATSLVIPEIKKTKKGDKTGWVDIDIVNYNPMGKNKAYCGFMYYVTPPEARKFPKVENFQGRFVEKDGRRGIELTWDPVRGATRGTEKLFSNYTKTEYFYPIPDDVKPGTELRFEIYVRRRINEKWPPTILRGPWVSARFMVK